MIGTFLDKLQGLFDARFVVAFWAPIMIGLGSAINLILFQFGYTACIDWWFNLDASRQLWTTVMVLFVATILAFVLQSFSTPLVRTYAGFNWPTWLRHTCISWQNRRYNSLAKRGDSRSRLYENFPEQSKLIQPTAFGNRLQAGEEYALRIYNVDSPVWWPRLTVVFPETFRRQIDGALTPMLALLNICTLLLLVATFGFPLLLWINPNWILVLVLLLGQLIFATMCYLGVLSQERVYSALVRTGFDLYRHEILRQLRISLPDSLAEERKLWPILTSLCLFGDMPWSDQTESQESTPQHKYYPFYYDTHKSSSSPQPNRMEIKITQIPEVVLKQGETIDPL